MILCPHRTDRYSPALIAHVLLMVGFLPPVLQAAEPLFTDEAERSGIRFTHFNGMTGDFHLPEVMGAGGALVDYDNDGDLDVYLVQGNMLDGSDFL